VSTDGQLVCPRAGRLGQQRQAKQQDRMAPPHLAALCLLCVCRKRLDHCLYRDPTGSSVYKGIDLLFERRLFLRGRRGQACVFNQFAFTAHSCT